LEEGISEEGKKTRTAKKKEIILLQSDSAKAVRVYKGLCQERREGGQRDVSV
jgi:hypothetical protein